MFYAKFEIKVEENFTKMKVNLINCKESEDQQKEVANNLFKLF